MKQSSFRHFAAVSALALALSVACVGCGSSEQQEAAETTSATSAAEASEQASSDLDATVYTSKDEGLKLSQIADGKPLVLNFWATWCPYCVQELPDFQKVAADFKDTVNFAFVDVLDDDDENVANTLAWLQENGFEDLPVYYDKGEASEAFGVYALPLTVVISADGKVVTTSTGVMDPMLLRGALSTLV